jgi:serpin B
MNKLYFFLLLLIGSFSPACKVIVDPPDPEPVSVDSVAQVAQMNQTLGWKVFKKEQFDHPNKNILISPFSIHTALTMAANGAKGNTRSEILNLMGCENCNLDDLNQLHEDLTTLLTQQSGQADLTVANHFFYDNQRVTVKIPFLETLSTHYNSGADNLNFTNEQASLDQINNWVKTNTNNKIEKILERIDALDVAFLINALHFKADWATGFAEQLTSAQTFTKGDGTTVEVDFVTADRNFSFAQSDDYRIVDIPFKDSIFSVSFIQPGTLNTNGLWVNEITPQIWQGMYANMQYNRAMVFFPKLKLTYDNDLINTLKTLGVQDAFSAQLADFTDLGTASNNIFINQIKHKAVLEIDEKGAEGAAVTSIGFGVTSAPPTFWFNRPFVLVLRHIPTNTLIFTGYVANPAS